MHVLRCPRQDFGDIGMCGATTTCPLSHTFLPRALQLGRRFDSAHLAVSTTTISEIPIRLSSSARVATPLPCSESGSRVTLFALVPRIAMPQADLTDWGLLIVYG